MPPSKAVPTELIVSPIVPAANGCGYGYRRTQWQDQWGRWHWGHCISKMHRNLSRENVKLEVLDWGGSGEVMVLLTGLGDNAHVFDYFALQFTDFFHVIGITRRGWLPSSQPENGYDVETRAADDIKVLDALGIRKAVFVGHSVSGSELSKIAVKYPSYVDKLVYLDASDLSEGTRFPDIPSPFSLFTDADPRSLFALQAAYARLLAVREPIPAICLSFKFDKNGMVTGTSTPDSIQAKLSAGVNIPANPPTNWADIKVPRLGIFAPPTVESKLPWYWYLSPPDQAVFDARFPCVLQWFTDVIDKFSRNIQKTPPPRYIYSPALHTTCTSTTRRRSCDRCGTS